MRVKYHCCVTGDWSDDPSTNYVISELCCNVEEGLERVQGRHKDRQIIIVSFHVVVYGKDRGRIRPQRAHLKTFLRAAEDAPLLLSNFRRK